MSQRNPTYLTPSTYRFPEVGKARNAFELFVGESMSWSNDFDQWQLVSKMDSNPHNEDNNVPLKANRRSSPKSR
jgi:hypothetical protein